MSTTSIATLHIVSTEKEITTLRTVEVDDGYILCLAMQRSGRVIFFPRAICGYFNIANEDEAVAKVMSVMAEDHIGTYTTSPLSVYTDYTNLSVTDVMGELIRIIPVDTIQPDHIVKSINSEQKDEQ